MDFAAFVKLRAKEGRQTGTTQGGMGSKSASKVVRRRLATKKETFYSNGGL
jgi:hypothetical protein